MVGPLLLLSLFLVKNIVSDDVIMSQVIRTETLVISTKNTSSNNENTELVKSLSLLANTTKSSFLHKNNEYSKSNESEKKASKQGKHSRTSEDALKNLSNLYQENASNFHFRSDDDDIPEPVEVASDNEFPIKFNNYSYILPNKTKRFEHKFNATSEQNPHKPAWPAGTTANNPNATIIDRSAFVGDLCATGYVKVNGVCVQPE